MLTFMEYIQLAFIESTNWNRNNSYSSLTWTARGLLDFTTPEGLRLHVSSLASPYFATSYTLGTIGVIDGSISYLFSSIPLYPVSQSSNIHLRSVAEGYRQISQPRKPDEPWWSEIWKGGGQRTDQQDTLLHATFHLPPPSTLHGLFLRRLSPTSLLSLSFASSAPTGATLLAHLSSDVGKYSTEYLFSTNSALLGFRGLWNFGPDPRNASPSDPPFNPPSLLSAGAELYYSPLSSMAGLSTGLRFTTLPGLENTSTSQGHSTFPYTLTLTLTPLTGSMETTYSVRASPNLAMSSQFSFNFYSWESEIVLGWEIWRRRRRVPLPPTPNPDPELPPESAVPVSPGTSTDTDLDWLYDRLIAQRDAATALLPPSSHTDKIRPEDFDPDPWRTKALIDTRTAEREKDDSVLKVRVDQSWNVRLLWEGRVKELLVSAGVSMGPVQKTGLGGREDAGMWWRGVGVEVSYSS